MAVNKILTWPNKILKQKSDECENSEALSISEDLRDTMIANFGIGIAAPQIGINKRVCVIKKESLESLEEDNLLEGCIVLVNPEIQVTDDRKVNSMESCLSVPNLTAVVDRSKGICLTYENLSGEKVSKLVSDRDACVIQHEVDHLEGKVFIQRLSHIKQKRILAKINRGKRIVKAITGPSKQQKSEQKAKATMRKNKAKRKNRNKKTGARR